MCSLAFLAFEFKRNFQTVAGSSAGRVLVSFWFIYSIRLIHDTVLFPTQLARAPEIYWAFGYGLSLIPALACMVPLTLQTFRASAAALAGGFSIVVVLAFVLGFGTLDENGGRLAGNDVMNPITIGHIASGLSLISLDFFITSKGGKKSIVTRILSLFGLALGLATLVFSGSRGPMLAFVVAITAYISIKLKQSRSAARVVPIIIVTLLLCVAGKLLLDFVIQTGGAAADRFENMLSKSNVDSEARSDLWRYGIIEFLQNPISGSFVDIPGLGYPHNVFIEAFMATGFIGGGIFVFLVYIGLRAAFVAMSTTFAAWAGAMYVQYVVGVMFSGTLYDNFEFWYLYSLVAVASLRARDLHSLTHTDP